MRQIVFDTETTGLNPNDGDRLTEIGCVEVVDFLPTGRVFHTLLNPERDIPPEVTKITGHTWELLREEPKMADVVDDFLAFVGGDEIVAHNAKFDRDFINAELRRAERPPIPDARFVDTLDLARVQFPGSYNSLDALCKRFNISLDSREKHGALIDAKLLAQVYLELNGGRERGLDLAVATGPQTTDGATAQRRRPRPTPLGPLSTDEERAAHAAFVDTLGPDAVWRRFQS